MNAVLLGLVLGGGFGAAARAGQFCLLRGMKGVMAGGDLSAIRAFALALAVAICATQVLNLWGGTDLAAALPMRDRFSWVGMLAGGAIFGIGMVLANACGARSLVLAAGGNMRSVLVLLCLGLAAQASLTGVLAPLRGWVASTGQIRPAAASLPQLFPTIEPQLAVALVAGPLALVLVWFALPLCRRHPLQAACAAIIGLAVAGGWWITHVTDDPFDPRVLTSISFIGPMGDGMLWLMLSTGRALNFGVAVVAGTALGALAVALLSRDFRPESFGSATQMQRAMAGGVLMGFGGVLALGCSIGQGLSGVSTLSLASLVAFSGILAGIAVGLVVIRS